LNLIYDDVLLQTAAFGYDPCYDNVLVIVNDAITAADDAKMLMGSMDMATAQLTLDAITNLTNLVQQEYDACKLMAG
jgi:hypothetical protein